MLEAASQAERCLLLVRGCDTRASKCQLCACMRGAWLEDAVPCSQQRVFGIVLCCVVRSSVHQSEEHLLYRASAAVCVPPVVVQRQLEVG